MYSKSNETGRILARATVVTLVSVLISLAIVVIARPALGGSFDAAALVMALVCPTVVAFPATAFTYRQKLRLKRTMRELADSHAKLAETHAALAIAHEELARTARIDKMTGMLNRESFFEALEQAQQERDGGTLLFIDADNFKTINDTFGHGAGDEALRLITAAISSRVRTTDMLGRIGGEEFAVFLCGADDDEAAGTAERIRRAVEELVFRPDGRTGLRLTVSIGGVSQRKGSAMVEIMREADRCLYLAKSGGRNRVVLADGLTAAA